MDNSLVLNTIPYKIELIKVLILVVMDNSLVPAENIENPKMKQVS